MVSYDLVYRDALEEGQTEGTGSQGSITTGNYGVVIGFNVPFKELSDRASVGLNTGFTLGMTEEGPGLFNVPIMGQFKFNNDATWKGGSGLNLGFGFGAGAQVINFFSVSAREGFTYVSPAIMAEINVGEKKSHMGIVKIRYTHNFASYEIGRENDFTQDYAKFTQAWSIGFIFTPSF